MLASMIILLLAPIGLCLSEELVSTNTTEWTSFIDCMDTSGLSRVTWNITLNDGETNVITQTSDEELQNNVYLTINQCQDSAGIGFSYNAVNLMYNTNKKYFLSYSQYMAGNIGKGDFTLPDSGYMNPLKARLSEVSYNARIHHRTRCGGAAYKVAENWKADGVCIQPVRQDGSYFDIEGSFGYDYNGWRVWLLTCPYPRCRMHIPGVTGCRNSECNVKNVAGTGNAQCFNSPVGSFQWIHGGPRPSGYCGGNYRVVYATQLS